MAEVWNAEKFRDYLREHHEEYEPVFWSGYSEDEFHDETQYADEKAVNFCEAHPECKTVGTLVDEAGFDQNDESINWKEASQIFAEESSGKAHVFIGDKCDFENNEWNSTERDAVIHNDKIEEIDCHDVVTGVVNNSYDKDNKDKLPSPHQHEQKKSEDESISQ